MIIGRKVQASECIRRYFFFLFFIASDPIIIADLIHVRTGDFVGESELIYTSPCIGTDIYIAMLRGSIIDEERAPEIYIQLFSLPLS